MAQTKTVKGVKYKKTTGDWFKAGGQKAKVTLNRVTPGDYIRLGADAAQLKSQMTPKAWAASVKAAHSQGWTVASALDSSTPASLKQRTKVSMQKEAQRTIDDAYKPQVAELDYADKQAEGMRQKRLSDQASYDQWSSQQAAKTAGSINAAQQKYMDTIKASTDATVAQANQRQATLQGQVQQGAVGDMQNSIYVKGAAERAGADVTKAQDVANRAAATGPEAATRAAAVGLSNIGAQQARHSEIESDYNKTRGDIFKGRLKMNTDRAAAQVEQYSSLMKTEMDKASSNRNFQGLQSQITSKADLAKLKHQEFLLGQRGLNSRAAASNATAITTAGMSAEQRAADRTSRAQQGALNRSLKASEGAANRATQGKATKVDQAKLIAPVDRIAAILKNTQTGKHGKKGTGYLWNPATKHWEPARRVLTSYYQATDAQINAGLSHAMGKKLSPQQRQALGLA